MGAAKARIAPACFEQSADVVAAHLADERVALLVVEEVHAVLPQALVDVHAGAVVAVDRLGHEGQDLVVTVGHVPHHVLRQHHRVRLIAQGAVLEVDLALARRGDLVVVDLHAHAQVHQRGDDLGADVLLGVDRRRGEIAALVLRTVGQVRRVFAVPCAEDAGVAARVPDALVRLDEVMRAMGVLVERHAVEDEELELGAPEAGVGDPRRLQELLGLGGDVARVAAVAVAGDRVSDVGGDAERLFLEEGLHVHRGGVGEEEHVALVDVLEPPDARPVEAEPVLERAHVELLVGQREVLERAQQVGELDVDDPNALGLDEVEDFLPAGELRHDGIAPLGLCPTAPPPTQTPPDAGVSCRLSSGRPARASRLCNRIVNR